MICGMSRLESGRNPRLVRQRETGSQKGARPVVKAQTTGLFCQWYRRFHSLWQRDHVRTQQKLSSYQLKSIIEDRLKSKAIEHMSPVGDGGGHLAAMCVGCVLGINPHTCIYVFLMLGTEARASCMLCKGFTAEPHPRSLTAVGRLTLGKRCTADSYPSASWRILGRCARIGLASSVPALG